MRKIFLDTSGILALLNKRDTLHGVAIEANKILENSPTLFIISDYIVLEICNALAKHKLLGIKTLSYLFTSQDIELVKINENIWQESLNIYQQYHDKTWGLTDITSFVIMQKQGIDEAFTADHHFEQFGFKILLHK